MRKAVLFEWQTLRGAWRAAMAAKVLVKKESDRVVNQMPAKRLCCCWRHSLQA